jgi:pimeloyl-ACP methyl ester carboxylesterase
MLVRRYFESDDGTRLAYYVTGARDAPALVISAGLGGGIRAWSGLIEQLQRRLRIYAWDYRGLYASARPASTEGFSIARHAHDLRLLIEHERIVDPVLAGWSMGVQVNFELFRIDRTIPRALIALHGAAGLPLSTAFNGSFVERISPAVFHAMRRYWWVFRKPAFRLASSRRIALGFMQACQRAGIMNDACDPDIFHDMARDWVNLDLHAYADSFERLGQHDARDILPHIDVPTLVIGGEKDLFTPVELSRAIAAAVPGAELHVLPNATHFGLIEYPAQIVGYIERFLAKHGVI